MAATGLGAQVSEELTQPDPTMSCSSAPELIIRKHSTTKFLASISFGDTEDIIRHKKDLLLVLIYESCWYGSLILEGNEANKLYR
jgi:hypothetical protein